MSNTASNGGREVANDHVRIAVRRARRGARWVGAGELGAPPVPSISSSLVRVTWPGSRLVQFGADAALARSLATQRASETGAARAGRDPCPTAAGPAPAGPRPAPPHGAATLGEAAGGQLRVKIGERLRFRRSAAMGWE